MDHKHSVIKANCFSEMVIIQADLTLNILRTILSNISHFVFPLTANEPIGTSAAFWNKNIFNSNRSSYTKKIVSKTVNNILSISINICFGCSKEPSQCDGLFEYWQPILVEK